MFPLDQLKLAFTYHMVRRIVGADGDFKVAEEQWMNQLFPASDLESCGFLEGRSFTPRFQEALQQAMAELPTRLDPPEKLELIETFLGATLADGTLQHTEGHVLLEAAQILGLSPAELDRHLDTLDDVGQVELDAPLDE